MPIASDHSLDVQLRKLDPDVIRSNLVRAGLFLAGWELLKSEIQKKVREFYMVDLDDGPISAQRYASQVLALDSGPETGKVFRASLLWLIDGGAISEIQAARIRQMREHRNEIAHELPKILVDADHAGIDVALVRELRDIIAKAGSVLGTHRDRHGRGVGWSRYRRSRHHVWAVAIDGAPGRAAEFSAESPPSPAASSSRTP